MPSVFMLLTAVSFLLSAGCSAAETPPKSDIVGNYLAPQPDWLWALQMPACLEPNASENEQAAHALHTFELFGRNSWMSIGSFRYFAERRFRADGRASREICAPVSLYPRLTQLVLDLGYFDGSNLFVTEVGLARMIGPRDPRIVNAIGRTAFYAYPITAEEPLNRDVRPLARTVLAEFGPAASAYGEKAFSEMSADTALGTGAAQIAVSVGYPGALDRAERLMLKTLQSNRDPIPREVRDRLFELAYAITFAGPKAKDHLGPVYLLLDRRVESWAPPFGMIDLEPTTMCLVLQRVGGARASDRLSKPPCNAERLVLPG